MSDMLSKSVTPEGGGSAAANHASGGRFINVGPPAGDTSAMGKPAGPLTQVLGQKGLADMVEDLLAEHEADIHRIYDTGLELLEKYALQQEEDAFVAQQMRLDSLQVLQCDLKVAEQKLAVGRALFHLQIGHVRDDEENADLAEAYLKSQMSHLAELTAQLEAAERRLGGFDAEVDYALAERAELADAQSAELAQITAACEAQERAVAHLRELSQIMLGQRKDVASLTKRLAMLEAQGLASERQVVQEREANTLAAPAQRRKPRKAAMTVVRKGQT